MEEQSTQNTPFSGMQQPLPNATAVLVLGIISIVGCFCYGIPGLICGIISLVMAGKAKALYNSHPDTYTQASYKNMSAGRICAIIGTILSSLYFIFFIIIIATIGISGLSDPNLLRVLRGH